MIHTTQNLALNFTCTHMCSYAELILGSMIQELAHHLPAEPSLPHLQQEVGQAEIPVPAYLCQTGSRTGSWFCSGVPGQEGMVTEEGECSIGDLERHRKIAKGPRRQEATNKFQCETSHITISRSKAQTFPIPGRAGLSSITESQKIWAPAVPN